MIYHLPIAYMVLFSFFSCSSGSLQKREITVTDMPNILFIAVDDLRPELGIYGANHIKSPELDQLAQESMVFERTYCNVPVCGASRASLLSGVRPGRHRFISYNTYLDKDYPGVVSLPMLFKNNGYITISNGKIYHHSDDDLLAWDEVWQPSYEKPLTWRNYLTSENIELEKKPGVRGYPYEKTDVHDSAYFDGRIAQKAIHDLNELKKGNNPFFLAVGFVKPHLPFNAPAKYWEMYDSTQISLPANYLQPETTPRQAFHNFGELRNYSGIPKNGDLSHEMNIKLLHGYYACVSYVDAQIGLVLKELKELGLDENTVVILWGDHGYNLADHKMWAKHCNFESSLHVPMMIKIPGKTKGQRSDAITEYIDIYPSLAELAGLDVPKHVDGESFISLIDGMPREKDYAVSKFNDGITLIQGDLFYTEWLNDKNQTEARMLFDHSTDSLELNNLAEKPEYRGKVKELNEILHNNLGDDFYLDRRK